VGGDSNRGEMIVESPISELPRAERARDESLTILVGEEAVLPEGNARDRDECAADVAGSGEGRAHMDF